MNDLPQGESNRIEPLPFGESPKDGALPGGCGKGAVIGCGVLLLLLGIGAVIFAFNAPKILTWVWDAARPEVERKLSQDLDPEEREAFSPAYQNFVEAVQESDVDPELLAEIQTIMMQALQQEKSLTADESKRLIEAMGSVRLSEQEIGVGAVTEIENRTEAEEADEDGESSHLE